MPTGWKTSGNAYGIQDGAVYVKRHNTLTSFVWGGRCMKMEEGTETLGGFSVSTRFDPRGGIERDSVLMEPPGETTGSLVMKRLQGDRAKTDLRSCLWDIDVRMMCGGLDRDAPRTWEEITRYCKTKMSDRAVAGINWEGDEEAMITFSTASLSVDDIYRVGGSEGTIAGAAQLYMFTDVDVCQPGRCPDRCDDQEECVVVAVTENVVATGNPRMLYNLAGGDNDNWTVVQLAAMGAFDAVGVVCLGSFWAAISTAGTVKLIYADTYAGTQTSVTTPFASGAPSSIDAIDQSFIVIGGASGYVYTSRDAARTWTTVSSGEAMGSVVSEIMIARDNPRVIYGATSAATTVIKSENGGRTWFPVGAIGAGTAQSMYVINQSTVLIGNAAGQLFQTVDGGVTWTEQLALPNMGTKGNVTIESITGCGCGVLYLSTTETGGVEAEIYRNVDGGTSGSWYVPADIETLGVTETAAVQAIACCGPNHLVGVGGESGTAESVIVVS